MTDEKGNNLFWNEWQDILLAEFESRLTAIGSKGHRGALVRKNFTVLFLQDKGFKVPAADVIQEAIRIISEREANDPCYDTIAMMGHRIGMVDNIVGLKQCLQDLYQLLKPEGQVLLISIDIHATNGPEHNSSHRQHNQSERYLGVSSMQFQRRNLIGPLQHVAYQSRNPEKPGCHDKLAV